MAPAAGHRRDRVLLAALTFLTADAATAAAADVAGVERVGVDLERRGKSARQAGRGTHVAGHTIADLERIVPALDRAAPFARLDPWGPWSPRQVEDVLAAGARVVMLPMFRCRAEAEAFAAAVGGRARCVLLLETAEALEHVDAVLAAPGVDEVHVGLNDLTLALGGRSRFETLAGEAPDRVAAAARSAGVAFAAAGVARPDLPLRVPPELVIARLVQLGATGTLLARGDHGDGDLPAAVSAIRAAFARWRAAPPDALESARVGLGEAAACAPCWSA